MEPLFSPWGEIQDCEVLCPHVFSVGTASHGGIMVNARVAKSIFSNAALQCAFCDGGYYCFEEDCAAAVALRELMDRGLYQAPVNEYWKPGKYEEAINDSIQRWYPEYWAAHEAGETRSPVVKTQESLPKQCYGVLPGTGSVIIIKQGETGYYKTDIDMGGKAQNTALVEEYNQKLGVSKAQAQAMLSGSMFGWHTPAADPKNYDENGKPIKPKQKDRGDAR